MITKSKFVGRVGHHNVYSIERTLLVPLFQQTQGFRASRKAVETRKDEIRYVDLLSVLNLSKDFYFSYQYNLCQSLQQNSFAGDWSRGGEKDFSRFMWNWKHMEPFREKHL
jgi:hypothetical protein